MAKVLDAQNDWGVDKKRLILYADIMGFKNTVMSTSHAQLKARMHRFRTAFHNKIEPLKSGDYLRFAQFSDSLIVVVNGTDSKMVQLITKAATILMHEALSSSFPIKGVIAEGVFTYEDNNQLYFGRPLVDAALLHDEVYFYGIVVHNSAEATIKKSINPDCPYTNSSVPLKKGKTSHYHLAWNLTDLKLKSGDITDKAKNWLEKIQEQVSGSPRIYVDNTFAVLECDKEEIPKIYSQGIKSTYTSGYFIP